MSFVEKLMASYPTYCYSFKIQDELRYVVLRMSSMQHRKMEVHISLNKPIQFSDYGKILASGTGKRPDEKTIARLKAEHNVDLQFDD